MQGIMAQLIFQPLTLTDFDLRLLIQFSLLNGDRQLISDLLNENLFRG